MFPLRQTMTVILAIKMRRVIKAMMTTVIAIVKFLEMVASMTESITTPLRV